MLSTLIAMHIGEEYGCEFINIPFTKSTVANTSYTLDLKDAEGASTYDYYNKLQNYDFVLQDIYVYAPDSQVRIDVLPDNDTSKRFMLYAYEPKVFPILPTKLIQVDLILDVKNETATDTDLFISFFGFYVPQQNTADLYEFANRVAKSFDIGNTDEDRIVALLEAQAKAEGYEYEYPEGGGYVPGGGKRRICRVR